MTLGIDLDDQTVELLDSILVNVATDEEVRDEFRKLKFIKSLKKTYNGTPGPIEQILIKMAEIERHYIVMSIDNKRLVADMNDIVNCVENLVKANTATAKSDAIVRLSGIVARQGHYSWNQKNGNK